MSKPLISLVLIMLCVLATGCASIDGQRFERTTTAVVNNVANNAVLGAGDTTECMANGVVAGMGNKIVQKLSGDKYGYGNVGQSQYTNCLWQKQSERQQAMWRAQMLQDEARRDAQRRAEEAERRAEAMTPRCQYTLDQRSSNGKPSEDKSRHCTQATYEKWR